MFLARWKFTAQSGQTNKCVGLLRRWILEVASHVGWKPASVRVVTGLLGAPNSDIELEAHIDELSDLDIAWRDLSRDGTGKANAALMAQLEPLMVSGTSSWTVYKIENVIPAD